MKLAAGYALILAVLILFLIPSEENSIAPIEVPAPMAFEIRGQVRLFDRGLLPWSAVDVYDGLGNRIYMFQVDDLGQFVFPALAGETYIVKGAQGGYGYAPPEIKLENVVASRSDLLLYAGPAEWFPPACLFPPDMKPVPVIPNEPRTVFTMNWIANVDNPPCFIDLTATATDTEGNSATSPAVRFFILPPTASPSPTPTPEPTPTATPPSTDSRYVNGYVKVNGNYFEGSALVSAGGQTFITQPGGYFELQNVPIGSVLSALAPGHAFPSVTVDQSAYFILDGSAVSSPTPTPLPSPSPTPEPTPTPVPSPTPTPGPCTTRLPNEKCKKGCICNR